MESTDNNSNDDKSAAAELKTSVLQLPKRHAADLVVCRGLLWPPLQPVPCHRPQPNPCGGSWLWSHHPPTTVPAIPRLQLTLHPSWELPRPQACFWSSGFSHLPLPHPALLPCPTPWLSLRPVHPHPPPEWLYALPSLLQLWRLQLPSRAGLFQFSVANGETDVQTRIWSSTAVLLKALLLQPLSQFFFSILPFLAVSPFSSPSLNSSLLTLIPLSSSCLFPLPLTPTLPDSRGLLLYLSFLHYFSKYQSDLISQSYSLSFSLCHPTTHQVPPH